MNQFERRNRAIDEALSQHAKEYKAILDKAEEEDRQPTEDDRAEITEHMKAIETLKAEKAEVEANIATLKEVDSLSKDLGPQFSDFKEVEVRDRHSESEVKDLGDQLIESKGYKELLEGGMSGGNWSSGPIELKATLASTPGSALTPNQYVPGIVSTLFQRNYVSDLPAQVQTNASQITYVKESTATNAAAAVSEGQAKPQSTLAFTETTESVRKIATILPVTDELLADAPQIQAYVNSRLILFVKNTEEQQVLLGSGTAPNIQGLIAAGRNTVGTYARGTVDSNAIALFKAMNGTRGSSQLDPDAIVIHPTNWQAIRVATDTSGQLFGGGPFYGPYGGPQGPASSSQFSADNIWGVPVVVTSNITVGSALVGNFSQGAAVYRRSGVTVEATNSHSTWFADNITALRAEERLALAVYRESAFTVVTGLN
jgi:HK97 family phage major capsid protein